MRDTSVSGLKALIARGNTTQVEIAADPDSDEISEALRTFAVGGGGLVILGVRENGDSGAIPPRRVPNTLEELRKSARNTPRVIARINATKDGDNWLPYIEVETDAPPAALPFQSLTSQQRRLLARVAGFGRAGVYRSDFVAGATQNLGWYVLASGAGRSKRFSGFEETDLHAIATDGYITLSTWYDRDQIRWGDSVVGRINEGLRHCRFVLVVLSENFLAKPWARRELESALGEEASSGQLRVLPLLVGSESQRSRVLGRFPLLTDKKYLVWSAQHHEIVAKLRSLLEDLEP